MHDLGPEETLQERSGAARTPTELRPPLRGELSPDRLPRVRHPDATTTSRVPLQAPGLRRVSRTAARKRNDVARLQPDKGKHETLRDGNRNGADELSGVRDM